MITNEFILFPMAKNRFSFFLLLYLLGLFSSLCFFFGEEQWREGGLSKFVISSIFLVTQM